MMTESEWQLKRENLSLRIALAKAEAQICQREHDRCVAELQGMGESWTAEPMKHNGSGERATQ